MPAIKLTEKKKWEIASSLSDNVDQNNWHTYAGRAGMNIKVVEKKNTDLGQCLSLVEQAIKQDALLKLLKDALFNGSYDGLVSELETGHVDKLKTLAQNIASGNCILFLGPGVLRIKSENGKTFNEVFTEHLRNELENNTVYFDPTQVNNLTYMVQRYTKTPRFVLGEVGNIAARKFSEFMKKGQVDTAVFEMLDQFPWKLVINANPDSILIDGRDANTYLKRKYSLTNNIDNSFQKLEMDSDSDEMEQDGKIFFYNLFGTFEDPQSIVYTESEFLTFISNVVNGSPTLHSYVTRMFDDKKYYFFIGFDFDQWYFKILAKTLNLNKNDRALSIIKGGNFSECNLDFFEQEFKFYFVDEDTNAILTELTDIYKALKK